MTLQSEALTMSPLTSVNILMKVQEYLRRLLSFDFLCKKQKLKDYGRIMAAKYEKKIKNMKKRLPFIVKVIAWQQVAHF